MKSKRTRKYDHVRSIKDLENEILRFRIKKNILEQDLKQNLTDFKHSLYPGNIIREALGFATRPGGKFQLLTKEDNIFNNGKIFTYLKYLALAVSTVKGGSKVVRRIKRIFS